VQRTATTDDAGASVKPKRDPVRGAGRGLVAGGDEEQQREAQWQHESQQQDEEQQRDAQRQHEL
jgi:hypothetical protein